MVTNTCIVTIGLSYAALSIIRMAYGDIASAPDWLLWIIFAVALCLGLAVAYIGR